MSETQGNDSPPVIPTIDPARKVLIDSILGARFPALPMWESLAAFTKNSPEWLIALRANVDAERKKLTALPLAELKLLRTRQIAAKAAESSAADARRKAETEAKEHKREKSRFYSKSTAFADLTYWAKFEYWTFDEAVALLFGRDPKVVTAAAMKSELPLLKIGFYSSTPPYSESFVFKYAKLRDLAARAGAMTKSQRLRPKDVIAWALEIGHAEVPTQFLELLKQPNALTSEAPKVQAPPGKSPTQTLKKAALIKKYFREWSSIESDLKHGDENGLSKAAKSPAHGYWNEEAAVQWAKQNGKMPHTVANIPPSLGNLPTTVHTMRG